VARFTGIKEFKPSSRTVGVESRMDIRFDIQVSEYDATAKQQGDAIIPYLSMRLMSIKSAKSGERQLLAGLDNDSNRQYKNIVVSDKIWNAMIEECRRAVDEAVERELKGTGMTIVSNVNIISNAAKFAEASNKVAERRAEIDKEIKKDSASIPQAGAASEALDRALGSK
jgi:hypothetical protein